jgi:Galactoside-binding lectin
LDLKFYPESRQIVANHRTNNIWGEEVVFPLNFKDILDGNFDVCVLAHPEYYKIAFNGRHVGNFRHRIPVNLVYFLRVSGSIKIDIVFMEKMAFDPGFNPIAPYLGLFSGGIQPNSAIRMRGNFLKKKGR